MAALAMVGTIFMGCTENDLAETHPQTLGKGVTLTTTISLNGSSTRALDANGKKTFAEGDQIAIFYKNTSGETQLAESDALKAVDITNDGKTAKITVTFENPQPEGQLRYIYPAAMAMSDFATIDAIDNDHTISTERLLNDQDGTLKTLASKFDLAIYDGKFTKDALLPVSVTLKNQLAIVEFNIKDNDGNDITNCITNLQVQVGPTASPTTYTVKRKATAGPIYVAMMPCNNSDISIIADNGSFKKKDANGITLAANNMYPFDMKMTFDALNTPLTLEAAVAGAKVTFKVGDYPEPKDIEYSTDGGATWKAGNTGGDGVEVTLQNVGDKVMFRGNNSYYSKKEGNTTPSQNTISCTADCYVYGNIMSLISKDNFATLKQLTETWTFNRLFFNNTHLKNHPNAAYTLELPATTLTDYCYRGLFWGCTSLVTPPALPATELQQSCYIFMFDGCSSLTTAPELPATTLAESCYQSMFTRCTSLETTPKLAATELAKDCYLYMFDGCTSLKEVWVKANYKADNGECTDMFKDCTNATTNKFHTDDTKDHWTAAFSNLSEWQFSAYE